MIYLDSNNIIRLMSNLIILVYSDAFYILKLIFYDESLFGYFH